MYTCYIFLYYLGKFMKWWIPMIWYSETPKAFWCGGCPHSFIFVPYPGWYINGVRSLVWAGLGTLSLEQLLHLVLVFHNYEFSQITSPKITLIGPWPTDILPFWLLWLCFSPPMAAGLDAQSRVAPGVPHEEFAALDQETDWVLAVESITTFVIRFEWMFQKQIWKRGQCCSDRTGEWTGTYEVP